MNRACEETFPRGACPDCPLHCLIAAGIQLTVRFLSDIRATLLLSWPLLFAAAGTAGNIRSTIGTKGDASPLLPREQEAANLLVTSCISASTIA